MACAGLRKVVRRSVEVDVVFCWGRFLAVPPCCCSNSKCKLGLFGTLAFVWRPQQLAIRSSWVHVSMYDSSTAAQRTIAYLTGAPPTAECPILPDAW